MDYCIWYRGVIIGNIQAGSSAEAQSNAETVYGPDVVVELT